jgi:hypothetical protein
LLATVTANTPPTPPPPAATLKGPASLDLYAGYEATAVAYTVTGRSLTYDFKCDNSRITWDASAKSIRIAAGLPAGAYTATVRALSPDGPSPTLTFTLTVKEKVYFVGYPQSFEGGTVAVSTTADNPYLSEEGETVTLVVTPDDGYELESLTVYDYDNGAVTVPLTCTDGVCTFVMPAHSVSIVAVFRSTATSVVETDNYPSLRAFTQNGTLYISGLQSGAEYRIYNLLGTFIYQGVATGNVETRHATSLPGRGVYIVVSGDSVVKVSH